MTEPLTALSPTDLRIVATMMSSRASACAPERKMVRLEPVIADVVLLCGTTVESNPDRYADTALPIPEGYHEKLAPSLRRLGDTVRKQKSQVTFGAMSEEDPVEMFPRDAAMISIAVFLIAEEEDRG